MIANKPATAVLLFGLYGLSSFAVGVYDPLTIVLALPLVWLSVVDLFAQIIPDRATVLVAIWGLARTGISLETALNGAVASILLIALWGASEVFWRKNGHEALGLGDVKLIAAGVLCVGAENIWLAVLMASLGGIAAVLIGRLRATGADIGVPFGPFIAYGLFLTVVISGSE